MLTWAQAHEAKVSMSTIVEPLMQANESHARWQAAVTCRGAAESEGEGARVAAWLQMQPLVLGVKAWP